MSASWPFKDANGKPDYNIIVSEEEMAELESIIGATTPDDKLAALRSVACDLAAATTLAHNEPQSHGAKVAVMVALEAFDTAAVAYGDEREATTLEPFRRMWATGNLTMVERMERIAAILEEAELRAEDAE